MTIKLTHLGAKNCVTGSATWCRPGPIQLAALTSLWTAAQLRVLIRCCPLTAFRSDELSWGFELHETFSLKQGVTFKLSNAGHIMGSCFILFTFPGDGTPDFRVIFSGDLGCTDTPIIPDPDPPDACDLLVLESTYGDRNHTGREDRVTALKKLLKRALEDKGIVYIPAFSLGRTQELIYELDRIKILNIKGPAIIIAGSGMCTGGRILDHLKNGLDNPVNDVFFVDIRLKVHQAGPSWKVKPHPEQASTLLPAIPPTQTRTP